MEAKMKLPNLAKFLVMAGALYSGPISADNINVCELMHGYQFFDVGSPGDLHLCLQDDPSAADEALYVAIVNNQTAYANIALLNGGDPSVARHGMSALSFAIIAGRVETAMQIMAHIDAGGALTEPDLHGNTPLHYAMGLEEPQRTMVVNRLLKKDVDVNARNEDHQTPLNVLMTALAPESDGTLIRMLIQSGADLELRDVHGYTPLQNAVDYRKYVAAEELIDLGADAAARLADSGNTLLHLLALNSHSSQEESGFIEFAEKVVAYVGDVDARGGGSIKLGSWATADETAFLMASRKGSVALMKALVRIGADSGALTDNRQSAIHLATYHYDPKVRETLEYLLTLGLSINDFDENGSTPLHLAAFNGNSHAVTALLDMGADTAARASAEDFTPWELVEYFREQGHYSRVPRANFVGSDAYWALNDATKR